MDTTAPTESSEEQKRAWLWDQQHQLVYGLELSALYHQKRQRFYSLCERWAQAITAIAATAAFSQVVGPKPDEPAFQIAAMVAAIASIFPLVFDLSGRANRHAVLVGDHRRLLAQIRRAGVRLAQDQLVEFAAIRHEIEAAEPASLGALVTVCQNELAVAGNHREQVVHVPWLRRRLKHLVDWQPPLPPAPTASRP